MTALTRGGLLRRAAVALGGAAGVAGALDALAGASASDLATSVLVSDGCTHGSSCRACNACVRHAANSLFATDADADANRAHAGCTCTVARGPRLPADTWRTLFGDPSAPVRGRVDRRAAWVAQALAAASVPPPAVATLAPAPAPAPVADPASAPASAPADPAATPPTGGTATRPSRPAPAPRCRVEVTRTPGGPLRLHVLVDRSCTVDARLLTREGRRVAGAYWHAATGASSRPIRLKRTVRTGTYRLRVRVSGGGGVRVVERRVAV